MKERIEEFKKLAPEPDFLIDIAGQKTKVFYNVESYKECKRVTEQAVTEMLAQLVDMFDMEVALTIMGNASAKAVKPIKERRFNELTEDSDMPRSLIEALREALGN
jgi:hypothetical protein